MSTETRDAPWWAVVKHLEKRFPQLVHESAQSIRFVVVVANRHHIGIRLRERNAYGARVVVMTAAVGVRDAMDPWTTLTTNALLVSGALAIDDTTLVLRTIVDDVSAIEAGLELFAREAATLKQELAPSVVMTTRATTTFTHFAD